MLKLEDILAKDPASLNDEEKAFLAEHADELSEEDAAKFGVEVEDEDEGVDTEAVKALVSTTIKDILSEKMDSITTTIAEKHAAIIKEQRKKAFSGKQPVEKGKDETRTFLKALFGNDGVTLKAMTTATGDTAKGGYLIPTELQNEVLRLQETQYGLARREFRYLPLTNGNTRTIPRLGSSVSVYWTNEGVKKTSTQPVFALVTQTLKKLAAIVPFTDELLEDSGINLTQLIASLFAEAVSKEEDLQFFNGTGSPWTGIFNASGTNVVNMAATKLVADVTVEDLQALIDATPSAALGGAKFYMHRTVLSKVRLLKDGDGRYIFLGAMGEGNPATILGYPVVTNDIFPASGVIAAKPFVLFGNLNMAAILGDKQQLRVKLLDQATITDTDGSTAINLAEQDMSALRVVERVGYVLAMPSAVSVLKTGPAS